jgi:hypothetical protein
MAAKNTLASRILAVLGNAEFSVSTPELCVRCAGGLSHPRRRVWSDLVRLERSGLVVKVTSKNGKNHRGPRPVRWALA